MPRTKAERANSPAPPGRSPFKAKEPMCCLDLKAGSSTPITLVASATLRKRVREPSPCERSKQDRKTDAPLLAVRSRKDRVPFLDRALHDRGSFCCDAWAGYTCPTRFSTICCDRLPWTFYENRAGRSGFACTPPSDPIGCVEHDATNEWWGGACKHSLRGRATSEKSGATWESGVHCFPCAFVPQEPQTYAYCARRIVFTASIRRLVHPGVLRYNGLVEESSFCCHSQPRLPGCVSTCTIALLSYRGVE